MAAPGAFAADIPREGIYDASRDGLSVRVFVLARVKPEITVRIDKVCNTPAKASLELNERSEAGEFEGFTVEENRKTGVRFSVDVKAKGVEDGRAIEGSITVNRRNGACKDVFGFNADIVK